MVITVQPGCEGCRVHACVCMCVCASVCLCVSVRARACVCVLGVGDYRAEFHTEIKSMLSPARVLLVFQNNKINETVTKAKRERRITFSLEVHLCL